MSKFPLKKKVNSKELDTEKNNTVVEEQEQSPHYLNVQALKNVFGEALSEDTSATEEMSLIEVEEIHNQEEETPPAANPPRSKRILKRSFYSTVGVIVIVLSIIGFISTLNFAINLGKNIADNTSLKNEFAAFIYPAVVIDPPAFDSSVQLPDSVMISASIWNIILNEEDKSKYASAFGTLTIPELDVEASAIQIFGKGLKFNHQTVGDVVMSFVYNPETKSYLAPEKPTTLSYSPIVESFTRVGERYVLRVAYMPPGHAWSNLAKAYSLVPDKYMEYTIINRNGKMTLVSVDYIQEPIVTSN